MTFSRRAAAEMTRRAARIAAEAPARAPRVLADGLTWAGTFHAVGARLLREHAHRLGLDPAFTIHDREDSADLMDLARHRLGLAATERRFPAKATCLAIYSRAVNAQRRPRPTSSAAISPGAPSWEAELRALFAAYVAAKQASAVLDYDDLLLYWAGMMQDAGARRRDRRPLRPRPRRRVPGHQPPAGRDPRGAEARRPRRHRRRRRRPVDLRLPRRAGPQHPRLPRALHPARPHRHPRAELPLDAGRSSPPPTPSSPTPREGYAKTLWSDRPAGAAAGARHRARRESARSTTSAAQVLDAREAGTALKAAGRPLPHRPPLGARSRSSSPAATSPSSSSAA